MTASNADEDQDRLDNLSIVIKHYRYIGITYYIKIGQCSGSHGVPKESYVDINVKSIGKILDSEANHWKVEVYSLSHKSVFLCV